MSPVCNWAWCPLPSCIRAVAESLQVLSVGSHIPILGGLQQDVFPQPAVLRYWPHPSCKSSAKYACAARCRASLRSKSTFLSVAGGLLTDHAAASLLIFLADWRSWLCVWTFLGAFPGHSWYLQWEGALASLPSLHAVLVSLSVSRWTNPPDSKRWSGPWDTSWTLHPGQLMKPRGDNYRTKKNNSEGVNSKRGSLSASWVTWGLWHVSAIGPHPASLRARICFDLPQFISLSGFMHVLAVAGSWDYWLFVF